MCHLILSTDVWRFDMRKRKTFWIINVLAMLVIATAVYGAQPSITVTNEDQATELFRADDNPGFTVRGTACTGATYACQDELVLQDTFLLQYVYLSVRNDPGDTCNGRALLRGPFTGGGEFGLRLIEIPLLPNSYKSDSLVLPMPIRMRAGDKLVVDVTKHSAGKCTVDVSFGGIRVPSI